MTASLLLAGGARSKDRRAAPAAGVGMTSSLMT
jgi:hypothetical protein